jgi:hypothetical protein
MKYETVADGKDIKLVIDPYELLHDVMTGEQRQLLIESLSCAEDIIEFVMQQVLGAGACTENGYSGLISTDITGSAIQRARLQITKDSSYAVKATLLAYERKIVSLEEQLKTKDALIDILRSNNERS